MGEVRREFAWGGTEVPGEAAPARSGRRLADKVLTAFHQACDQEDLEVAADLLRVLEKITTERSLPADANRRRSIETLVAAHERLWHLTHPEGDAGA